MGWGAFSQSKPVGAAWIRLWSEGDRGVGDISDDIPELGIAVLLGEGGKGVGTELLLRTSASSQQCFHAMSLSVLAGKPAVRLYRRMGFVKMLGSDSSQVPDHVAFTMVKTLSSHHASHHA